MTRGGGGSRQTVTNGDKGGRGCQKSGFLRWHTFWMAPKRSFEKIMHWYLRPIWLTLPSFRYIELYYGLQKRNANHWKVSEDVIVSLVNSYFVIFCKILSRKGGFWVEDAFVTHSVLECLSVCVNNKIYPSVLSFHKCHCRQSFLSYVRKLVQTIDLSEIYFKQANIGKVLLECEKICK